MTSWPPRPSPVRCGRYRYTRLRWRLSVRALDLLGAILLWIWRRFVPAPTLASPRRILVVQLDHLGDAVLSSPIFPQLRAAYPLARIEVLASLSNRSVFEINPHVDEVLIAERNWFERRSGGAAILSAVWTLGRRLRSRRYDLGIDVRGDVLTVLVLALARIPRRLGWTMGGGGFLLTDVAPWVPNRHEVHSRLALLRTLGLPDSHPPRVEIHLLDSHRLAVARRLLSAWPEPSPSRLPLAVPVSATSSKPHSLRSPKTSLLLDSDDPDDLLAGRFASSPPLLAVHLGAGTSAKRWPIPLWNQLLARFLDDGWRVVVLGGLDDATLAARLTPHHNLRVWTGALSIAESAALLERADLFLGADSGPAHLAASVGTTSVILFSGTNQRRQWRPFSRRSLVLRNPVPCQPCHRKTCPLANHPCMTGLSPDRVHRAALRWFARLHRQESPHAPL